MNLPLELCYAIAINQFSIWLNSDEFPWKFCCDWDAKFAMIGRNVNGTSCIKYFKTRKRFSRLKSQINCSVAWSSLSFQHSPMRCKKKCKTLSSEKCKKERKKKHFSRRIWNFQSDEWWNDPRPYARNSVGLWTEINLCKCRRVMRWRHKRGSRSLFRNFFHTDLFN